MKMYEKKCNKVYFQGEKLWQKWKNFSNYLKNLVDKSSNSFTKRRGNKSWLKALFPKLHFSMVHHLVIHYLIHVITLSILNWLRTLLKVHFWAIFWIEFTFQSQKSTYWAVSEWNIPQKMYCNVTDMVLTLLTFSLISCFCYVLWGSQKVR